MYAGFSEQTLRALEFWRQRALRMQMEEVGAAGEAVEFVPKFRLPIVNDYRKDPGSEFWAGFPVNRSRAAKSLVSARKLQCLAHGIGGVDMNVVEKVVRDLEEGAIIGCRGNARGGTVSRNASGCFDYPAQITDAIAGWLSKGFAAGPFSERELPEGVKVNGMMCRLKPTGAVRVILNLSAPEGKSVNDGIDSDEFPTVMSSTGQWLECLNKAGKGCLMTKIDWSDAYKHIHVHPEDQDLQWFEWLGKFFVELCLVFGAASSPGIYDRLAKVVLGLAVKLSGFPRDMICQYLDDVCAAMRAGSPKLQQFRDAYFSVAEQLGVRLSPEDDPDKAFAPRTSGVVLGVHYDTVSWTWSIPADKLGRLERQVAEALAAETLAQSEVWSLVGRIVHYCPLVPAGRFNIGHLVRLNSVSTIKTARVVIDQAAKRQLEFWLLILKVSSGLAAIPGPALALPAWAIECFTDAAGGSGSTVGLGCGGVSGDWWFYVPWGRKINTGVRWQGSKLSQKMSALELVGPLICLASGYNRVRNMPVRIMVDNSGSVYIWKKGYSNRCSLSTVLVSAIAKVAAGLGCTVGIEKVSRCSSAGPRMADALSKAAFGLCREVGREVGWELATEPAWIPAAILAWVADPTDARDLGGDILVELRKRTLVLGYNC